MIEIGPERVTPGLRGLFRRDDPVIYRCFAVIDGAGLRGRILTDDPDRPTWGVVWEVSEGTTFLGGRPGPATVAEVFGRLRQKGMVVVVLGLDDPRLALVPPGPFYDGRTLDFADRPVGEGLDAFLNQVPAGCRVQRLDGDWIMRTERGADHVRAVGGVEAWERTCLGYGLIQGQRVLSVSTAGPAAAGLREPGIFTEEAHRGKGYATIAAAHLIQKIEAEEHETTWNCAVQNLASAAVARKLGYRVEIENRCLGWRRA